MKRDYRKSSERVKDFAEAGLRVAEALTLQKVTYRRVADEAGVALSLVSNHMPTIEGLMTEVVSLAVQRASYKVFLQAFLGEHPKALEVDEEYLVKAIHSVFPKGKK